MNQFIQENIKAQIIAVAKVDHLAEDMLLDVKITSKEVKGICPNCGGSKFGVSRSKQVWKCWNGCGKSGKGAVSFLMDLFGHSFPEALAALADRYNIQIEREDAPIKITNKNRHQSFRDAQLLASGIPNAAQKIMIKVSDQESMEIDRYEKGTLNTFGDKVAGDDMILNYCRLDGKFSTYKVGRKEVLYRRVRFQNPDQFVSKSGKGMKYRSPAKSGNHLWLPNAVIRAYNTAQIFETLYVIEGEKKADRMCLAGLMTVAVPGIHNFSLDGEMPNQFQSIIKKCAVSNVVFLMDSDWEELKLKADKPVNARPKSFYRAADRFKRYFYSFNNMGIAVKTYIGWHHDTVLKGMDDLLQLWGHEDATLVDDLAKAMIDAEGKGEYVTCIDITTMTDYKLKGLWKLNNAKEFILHHKEELAQLHEFQYDRIKWRINEAGEPELAQQLLPNEKFWNIKLHETKSGDVYEDYRFYYTGMLNFLQNRGFAKYRIGKNEHRFVQLADRVLHDLEAQDIRSYVLDFTRQQNENEVLELLLKGGKQYIGPEKLNDLQYRNPALLEADRDTEYLVFEEFFWKITADGITEHPINELPAPIWDDNIIKTGFRVKLRDELLLDADRSGNDWELTLNDDVTKSDIANFYIRTSIFHWKKEQQLVYDAQGVGYYQSKEQPDTVTDEEAKIFRSNLMAKVLAAGYVAHTYRDYSLMKAIIAYDGNESEVGRSDGGTGKSIWAKQFKHFRNTIIVDGKRKNLEDDNHIYENVDERTNIIVYDDVRVNFNFEMLFSQITTSIRANPKGLKSRQLEPPKFIVPTNHALNGIGNSHDRRQYAIAFSDYYNAHRTPQTDFGRQLFHDWDQEQWTLYYNWMANCISLFMRYRLSYGIPTDKIERRKMRQLMGENFLDWATECFSVIMNPLTNMPDGMLLNKKVERGFMYSLFIETHHSERRYTDQRKFREKLQLFCEYAGLEFNPQKNGGRLHSGGKTYFCLGNEKFNASNVITINNQADLDSSIVKQPF